MECDGHEWEYSVTPTAEHRPTPLNSSCMHTRGNADKERVAVVLHRAQGAVPGPAEGAPHVSAKLERQRLHSQADAQHGDARPGPQQVAAHAQVAGVGGRARPGGDHDGVVGAGAEAGLQLCPGELVIADHLGEAACARWARMDRS